jgi:hypothetical protein
MRTFKCKVLFFDRCSGEGLLCSAEEGAPSGWINAACIPGCKTWFPHTACVYYIADQIIDVHTDPELGWIIPDTQGTFDSEKWNSLDHSRLAFKCDETGKAINGLLK